MTVIERGGDHEGRFRLDFHHLCQNDGHGKFKVSPRPADAADGFVEREILLGRDGDQGRGQHGGGSHLTYSLARGAGARESAPVVSRA